MLSLVSIVPFHAAFSELSIVVYGYRAELLAKLIGYLAIVSVIIWVSVLITVIIRMGAHRRYRSVRRLQLEVKRKSAYR